MELDVVIGHEVYKLDANNRSGDMPARLASYISVANAPVGIAF